MSKTILLGLALAVAGSFAMADEKPTTPAALDVTLPERGTVLSFGRSVQVDGNRPMAIELKLKRAGGGFSLAGLLVCLLAGGLVVGKFGVR